MTKKVYAKKQEEPDGTFGYWLMTSFGILMPAVLPAEQAAQCPPGTLQVRARDAAHLDHFREHWCPELGETIKTPQMDYDVRSLVSAEDLARAVAKMTLAVSARKFKPTTNGPDGLKSKVKADRLHDCYLRIWGAVTALSDKPFGVVGKTTISKPDPDASSKVCQEEGHRWPVGSKGGAVRVVACYDCDARKNTRTGKITYAANHKAWQAKPVPDATLDPFHVGSAL